MSRYYLDELGVKPLGDADFGDDKRSSVWREQRKKYGFDSRATWSLNLHMTEMLYERILMYKEKASEIVNLEYHTFEFEGETFTQLEMIDLIIENAKVYLKFEHDQVEELNAWEDDTSLSEDERQAAWDAHLDDFAEYEVKSAEAMQRVWNAWALVAPYMWW